MIPKRHFIYNLNVGKVQIVIYHSKIDATKDVLTVGYVLLTQACHYRNIKFSS